MKKVSEICLRDALSSFIEHFLPNLDCDGCTRFVAFMLQNKGIEFDIYEGAIHETGNKSNFFPIHNWIVTKNNTIFDFKTKKWIGVTSERVTYINEKRVDKKKFLSLGGAPFQVLGILLQFGVQDPINPEKFVEEQKNGRNI